ncbi:MAG TPA: hypothetical protein VFH29_07305, partial [Anaerolineales bacterium]|nr:hypothetical protein [Anaerolineales bacterium]
NDVFAESDLARASTNEGLMLPMRRDVGFLDPRLVSGYISPLKPEALQTPDQVNSDKPTQRQAVVSPSVAVT